MKGSGQGYIPFVADTLASGRFILSDRQFFFPYRFKHGTIILITEDEYHRMKARNWLEVEDKR